MIKSRLIDKFKWTILGLCGAAIILWILFYINFAYLMERETLKQMEQTADTILQELEKQFLLMEKEAFAIAQMPEVKEFLQEKDPFLFHQKAGEAYNNLSMRGSGLESIQGIILYDKAGNYYRMKGKISNVEAERLYYRIIGMNRPAHFATKSNMAYTDHIYNEKKEIGRIVILVKQSDILRILENYSEVGELNIALAAEEEVLVSDKLEYVGRMKEELQNEVTLFHGKELGFTEFQIWVTGENEFFTRRNDVFFISILITALLFLILVAYFMVFWKKHFFEPIVKIIDEVERFEGDQDTYLPLSGEEHFDGLVNQINEMIFRIDEKEKQLFKTQFLLQESEITRQRSLIIALKKQINAHFVINVLNVIKVLAEKVRMKEIIRNQKTGTREDLGMSIPEESEIEKVSEMCDGLSFLLRYANSEDEFITGMEEFFVLQKYITIMEIRYFNKFDAEVDIDDRLEQLSLPRMLMQPIVENALIHGLQAKKGRGMLKVSSRFEEDTVILEVSDNGVGMTKEQLELLQDKIRNVAEERWENKGTEHIALPNIQMRVESYYGKDYGLTIESSPEWGTKVGLRLPC